MNFDVTEGDPRYGFARALALSADGAFLAVGTANGHVKTYDARTGEPLLDRDISKPPFTISAVAFSRDGRYLAVGRSRGWVKGYEREPMLMIMDAETLDDTGPGPQAALDDVYSIAFGPTLRDRGGGEQPDGPGPHRPRRWLHAARRRARARRLQRRLLARRPPRSGERLRPSWSISYDRASDSRAR